MPWPRPSFAREGKDWPHRGASRFVEASGLTWHVQRMGHGPPALLLHGLGGATHSWRGLAPRLAEHFDVLALDLPGHGFTSSVRTPDMSLPGIARSIRGLLDRLDFAPKLVVGHSAGAAVMLRLAADAAIAPALLVGLNAAALPFEGWAGRLFPLAARLLGLNPLTPRLFAWSSDEAGVARQIRNMGSRIEPHGVALYARLFSYPAHSAGALGMMANWRLEPLIRDLPRVRAPVLLLVGANDRAVPPSDAQKIKALLPSATVEVLAGVGHLAHEEKPEQVAERIFVHARAASLL